MQEAVLSIEDNNFFSHSGVDFKGMLRASLAQFADAKSQGASTITMQVARNFYLPTEKTYTRKIYEVLLAFKIESQLSKPQILEIYMNQIYLGQRAYGFTSAAETYFGKSIKQVTVAEAAMLAGLPKAPSAYNPIVNPERATQRQRYIIDRMLENGYITPAQREEARAQVLSYKAKTVLPVHAEFVAEAARMLMFSRYGEDAYNARPERLHRRAVPGTDAGLPGPCAQACWILTAATATAGRRPTWICPRASSPTTPPSSRPCRITRTTTSSSRPWCWRPRPRRCIWCAPMGLSWTSQAKG